MLIYFSILIHLHLNTYFHTLGSTTFDALVRCKPTLPMPCEKKCANIKQLIPDPEDFEMQPMLLLEAIKSVDLH